MGHQLVFWQQQAGAPSPTETYQSLMHENHAPGLQPLPIEAILAALHEAFPTLDPAPSPDGPQPAFWEGPDTVVEFAWSPVHLMAEMRPAGRWSAKVANQVIDLLGDFQCPLFDPQTSERFA